jgi:hypothetical protein
MPCLAKQIHVRNEPGFNLAPGVGGGLSGGPPPQFLQSVAETLLKWVTTAFDRQRMKHAWVRYEMHWPTELHGLTCAQQTALKIMLGERIILKRTVYK